MTNYAIERGLPLRADDEGANNQDNQRKLFAAIRKAVPPSAQDIVSHITATASLCGNLVWAALADYYDANGAHAIAREKPPSPSSGETYCFARIAPNIDCQNDGEIQL